MVTIAAVIFIFIISISEPAKADSRDCVAEVPTTYRCASIFGYFGEDPYDVDRHSTYASDGTKHSCTSFAAFMLAKYNKWMPEISGFNSAQSWAVEAVNKVGATVSQTPHVGDIAQWGFSTDPETAFQHVAWVASVTISSSGKLLEIVVYDDNGGIMRNTTKRYLKAYVGSASLRWPNTFITFPKDSFGGGVIDRVPAHTTLPTN
jgi:hypothetical protein